MLGPLPRNERSALGHAVCLPPPPPREPYYTSIRSQAVALHTSPLGDKTRSQLSSELESRRERAADLATHARHGVKLIKVASLASSRARRRPRDTSVDKNLGSGCVQTPDSQSPPAPTGRGRRVGPRQSAWTHTRVERAAGNATIIDETASRRVAVDGPPPDRRAAGAQRRPEPTSKSLRRHKKQIRE